MESYLLLLGAQGCVCITCQHSAHVRVNECVRLTRPPTFLSPSVAKRKALKAGEGVAGCWWVLQAVPEPHVPVSPCPAPRHAQWEAALWSPHARRIVFCEVVCLWFIRMLSNSLDPEHLLGSWGCTVPGGGDAKPPSRP